MKAVSHRFGEQGSSIRKSGRNDIARKTAVYLIKRYSGLGNKEIGELFGGIHYSAVSKIYARIGEEIGKDKKLEKSTSDIMSHVKT